MSDDPVNQFYLVESASRLQGLFLFAFCPSIMVFDCTSCLSVPIAVSCFDHYSSLLSFTHVLDSSPHTMGHTRVTKHQLKRFGFVQEYFTFLDQIIAIDLAVCADTRSTCPSRQVTILFELLSLTHLAIFTNDINLDSTKVLIKNSLLLGFRGNFLLAIFLVLFLILLSSILDVLFVVYRLRCWLFWNFLVLYRQLFLLLLVS